MAFATNLVSNSPVKLPCEDETYRLRGSRCRQCIPCRLLGLDAIRPVTPPMTISITPPPPPPAPELIQPGEELRPGEYRDEDGQIADIFAGQKSFDSSGRVRPGQHAVWCPAVTTAVNVTTKEDLAFIGVACVWDPGTGKAQAWRGAEDRELSKLCIAAAQEKDQRRLSRRLKRMRKQVLAAGAELIPEAPMSPAHAGRLVRFVAWLIGLAASEKSVTIEPGSLRELGSRYGTSHQTIGNYLREAELAGFITRAGTSVTIVIGWIRKTVAGFRVAARKALKIAKDDITLARAIVTRASGLGSSPSQQASRFRRVYQDEPAPSASQIRKSWRMCAKAGLARRTRKSERELNEETGQWRATPAEWKILAVPASGPCEGAEPEQTGRGYGKVYKMVSDMLWDAPKHHPEWARRAA